MSSATMEATRVDIVYRPLRVGFALLSSDRASFRKVARLCTVLWGGRFNPIVAVDRPEADELVEVFRPDFLVPMGDDPAVAAFVRKYNYLATPLFTDELFYLPSDGRAGEARLLDIQNMLFRWQETAEWKHFVSAGVRIPHWEADDHLADVFLAQFGGFPDASEIGVDYAPYISDITGAVGVPIARDGAVPAALLDHRRLSQLSRFALEPHYTSDPGWIYPGLYVGDADNDEDLLNFWNLRACGIALLFLDLMHRDRTAEFNAGYLERLRRQLATRHEFHQQPALWSRPEFGEEARAAAGEGTFNSCTLGDGSWNGLNIRPQRMYLGEETALGIMGGSASRPRVRFALKEKPFAGDIWFHQQHLVASISLIGARSDGIDYTFSPPCIPELNGFAAGKMARSHDSLRIEPESVSVVIDAADHDISLDAIPVPALIERIFALAGFTAKISSSGLITRQLITRMGGVDDARAMKIPGVRRLLKTYGPNASFTRRGALQIIGQPDPVSGAKFDEHKYLYIEPRDERDLTPQMVFSHLVEKGLFRIGADLNCPACALTFWIPLDALNQKTVCTLCGNNFDATKQLVQGEYAYRRSGVLGLEKNTQGAIPVLLLLQQLYVNLGGMRGDGLFGTSYDLTPHQPASTLPTCETDFCIVMPTSHSSKVAVVIGECKDAGGSIDAKDIDSLRRVAEAFPAHRFEVFVLLAKLAPFNEQEIALARQLNTQPGSRRVIMLTARELEPYRLFERTNAELGLKLNCYSLEELAKATHAIYFAASKGLSKQSVAAHGLVKSKAKRTPIS